MKRGSALFYTLGAITILITFGALLLFTQEPLIEKLNSWLNPQSQNSSVLENKTSASLAQNQRDNQETNNQTQENQIIPNITTNETTNQTLPLTNQTLPDTGICYSLININCQDASQKQNCACNTNSLQPLSKEFKPALTKQELINAFNYYYNMKPGDSCDLASQINCHENSRLYYKETAESGFANNYYHIDVIIESLVRYYQATHNEFYLNEAKYYADTMISKAIPEPITNLSYWPISESNQGRSQIQEVQAGRAITLLARELKKKNDPKAQTYVNFVNKNIAEYWANHNNIHPLCKTIGDPSKCIPSAFDKHSKLALINLDIYAVTGDTQNKQWAEMLLNNLKDHYTIYYPEYNTVEIAWEKDSNGNPTIITYGLVGTSHSNRYPEMVIQAYEDGVVYNKNDLTKTLNTLLFTLWEPNKDITIGNENPYPNLYKGYMRGNDLSGLPQYKHGTLSRGWNKMGRYDQRARELMSSLTHDVATRTLVEVFSSTDTPPIGDAGTNRNYQQVHGFISEEMIQINLAECGDFYCG